MESIGKIIGQQHAPRILSTKSDGTRLSYCPTCSGAGFLRPDVSYSHPDFGKPVPCPDCHDDQLAQRLAAASQLTGWLQTARLDSFELKNSNREAHEAATRFVQQACGWLTFWGGYGVGKTHLLAGIVNACNAAKVGAVYYTLPDLLDMLRDAYAIDQFDHRIMRVLQIPVLAIDEVDKVRLTEWAAEKVYQICDARYRLLHAQGTVFASNTEPDSQDENLGYLYSRMRQGQVIHIRGGDERRLRKEQ